ncbi:DUF459 domain-containing protein [Vitiosangium sp. GDMCC 1.1324]|uniref:SGNH/GDSL hydrolase family protein n=1 Tax=Vitiosangium sp. (strain GDMCC 1.1324) TaxID=2138576 RepID=UPI000D3D4FC2|nr:DUF459 domain-containing protein [Vitiosangium sp. GDMCC 1.1324]PTL77214.1 DUF459 domain-containing protein [Vitiosangium sp. GDMCC 1.1324]
MEPLLARVLVCLAVLSTGVVRAAEGESPPAPELPAAQRTRTVLLLGDSLIVTSFGEYLEKSLNESPGVRAVRRAKSSTGLARPDFFDWMAVGREEIERHQPDVVVIIMGGNDGQGLTDDKGKAKVQWGASGWEAAYRQRVEDFLHVLAAPGRKILWVELPVTGLKNFERKLGVIRRVLREAVSAHEAATHLDTRPFFTDAKGALLREARVEGFRKPMRLRMDDGVHFTLAGGMYFASKVYPEVMGLLGSSEDSGPANPPPAELNTLEPAVCRESDAASEVPMTPVASCRP